ncbi:MAG: efflux RND transporter permease subunit [Leadbetterella sp.]|nr:efflux RND transporter permease subunit [Leadbetterella sp.]
MIGGLSKNKTTVYLITFLVTIAGYFIFNGLPKEQFPEIVVPQIVVQTVYAGTTPVDIENLINKPLEKQLKSEKGVKSIKSNALQDVSVIIVEFDTDVEIPIAKERVKSAIDKAKRDLPADLTQNPTAAEVNFSEFPIMNINLSGDFPLDKLKKYGEQLQDKIEAMTEITRVDIVGALNREIQINLDVAKMKSYGITFYDIQSAIQGENVNISGGELNVDNVRRSLRVAGEFKSMAQIQNVIIRSGQGATVRLGDVAEVVDSNAERQDFARLDNKSVVTLNVIKRGGENLVIASEKIEKVLEEFKKGEMPEGIKIAITADQSERTKGDINDLINTVILGFIFVVLVLMFFMGVKDAIFVGLSVPLSALLAFYPLLLMGFTLNTMVLFAFLLGLGIVVDDAIVVIENSHRLFNKHKELTIVEAVKLAASEVFVPVLSGTLTTIAPFFPLLFWDGLIGEFMKYLPYTLIFTLIASLIVAYVMNPIFAISFMRREEEEKKEKVNWAAIKMPLIVLGGIAILCYLISFGGNTLFRGVANFTVFIIILYIFNHFILTPKVIIPFQERLLPALKNNYKKLITWLIKGWRPAYAVLSMVGLLLFTGFMMGVVKPEVIFFPSAEPDYIYVYNVMPIGTDAVKTDQVTREIEKRVFEVIKENKAEIAINSVISNVGKNAGDPMLPDRSATPHKSKVTVAFVSKGERNGISSQELLNKVRTKLEGIPGTEISVQRENNGPPTGKPVSIEIVGKEFDEMLNIEKQVRSKITAAGIKGIEELKSDLVTNKPEIIVNVDREKASREGISSSQVAMAIRTALFGTEISKFRDSDEEYPIQLRLKQEDRNQVEKLLSMNITYRDMNMGGVLRNVPLASIADISYTTTFSQINRKDNERIITLGSDVISPFNATEVNTQIFDAISTIDLPSGYTIRQGGEQEEQAKTGAFLVSAFGVALIMIYLILAAQFNSIIKPIIIFVTILLSLIGVMIGFMIAGKTFSVLMSGVGVIALAGIVVKNGILIIEFTDELLARGYNLKDAIVEAGATRLTPVLLTAASAVLGLIPLAFGLTVDFGAMFVDLNPVVHTGGDSAVFWNILAWTIIYGLTFSTILTLLIVPCMYYINERLKVKLWKK